MALKTQLNFHEKVLSIRCCQSQFAMISDSKMKEIGSLIKNLKKVISWSKDTCSNSNAETDFSRPIFVIQAASNKRKNV